MKQTLKKELPLLGIVTLPFLYLAYVWNDLPEQVPMHWNMKGEIDRYGDKSELILIPFILPVLIYVLFLVIPKIDPKKKIEQMGNKYNKLKVILTTFMSVLAAFIIYSANSQSLTNPSIIILGVGLLFSILGNYFKTLKPNYFIGLRTPWTLENETVWKDTHSLGGKLWFIGGILIAFISLIFEKELVFYLFMSITVLITLIPLTYSYIRFKQLKQNNN